MRWAPLCLSWRRASRCSSPVIRCGSPMITGAGADAPHDLNSVVPEQLSAIILHWLEKEPDRRYQTADGLIYDLERLRRCPALSCPRSR